MIQCNRKKLGLQIKTRLKIFTRKGNIKEEK